MSKRSLLMRGVSTSLLLFSLFTLISVNTWAQREGLRRSAKPSNDFTSWQEVSPPNTSFTIKFPAAPKFTHIPRTAKYAESYLYSFRSNSDDISFHVAVNGEAVTISDSPYLRYMYKTIKVNGCPGEEWVEDAESSFATSPRFVRYRIIYTRDWQFILSVASNSAKDVASAKAQFFLDSFKLNTVSCNGTSLFPSKTPITLSAREIAQKVSPSIVMLMAEDRSGKAVSLGSGFFVGEGIVATNYHVVKGALFIYAKVIGQKELFTISRVIDIDQANDLALLSIKGIAKPALLLNGDQDIAVGDDVFVIGNPEGLEGTFSKGIVSAMRGNLIQITAPMSPGSSGSPVLNNRGEVIGIAVGGREGGQNLNFAISVSHLSALLRRSGFSPN